jgi:hypothetical protein
MNAKAHLRLATSAARAEPWSPGERSEQLLDAIARVHSARDTAAIQGVCVEVVERTLPGAAAALFGMRPGAPIVGLLAAGHRWRTAERDAPAWLARLSGPIANLVRSQERVSGGLVRTGGPEEPVPEGGLHVAQAPVIVGGQPWGSLVVVWPAAECARAADTWFVQHLASQVGLALGHVAATAEFHRSLASLQDAQRALVRAEQPDVANELTSGVADDLNSTLTTVLGVTEWLLHSQVLAPEARSDIEAVRNAAADAAHLVQRLQIVGHRVPAGDRDTEDLAPRDAIGRVLTLPGSP